MIAIRVLQPGSSRSIKEERITHHKRLLDTFHTIQSRAQKTGFVIEVTTTASHPDLPTFFAAVAANTLQIDWAKMTAS